MTDPIEKAAFRVEPGEAGERLDAFLARREPSLSRSRVKALLKAGEGRVAGERVVDPNRRLIEGEIVELGVPPPEDATPRGENIALDVVYEDGDLLVIDKPAGLVVHPGAGHAAGTLVNALIAHCGESLSGIGGVRRPGIVHRLDKGTSGLLVVAKNDAAHRALSAQFADHGRSGALRREYVGLAWGVPSPHIGAIDLPLNRDPRNRRKQAVARVHGRHAVTRYAVAERFRGIASLLALTLETGRTHQIRVHLAHMGHPIVGDPDYGSGFLTKTEKLPVELKGRVKAFRRQALHARALSFAHPGSGEILRFESNLPADMAALVEGFRKFAV